MAVDPLSEATRATKRNLLVASMLAITYKAFNITITAIPIAEVSIAFQKGAFAFLLIACISYLLITFILYFLIDIKNIEATEYENIVAQNFTNAMNEFREAEVRNLSTDLQRALPAQHMLRGISVDTKMFLRQFEVKPWEAINPVAQASAIPILNLLQNATVNLENPPNPIRGFQASHPTFLDSLTQAIIAFLPAYRTRAFLQQLRLKKLPFLVRVLYFSRNYLIDGAFPIALAIYAFLAMYDFVNLTWIPNMLPMSLR